jgi:hypothetical protein
MRQPEVNESCQAQKAAINLPRASGEKIKLEKVKERTRQSRLLKEQRGTVKGSVKRMIKGFSIVAKNKDICGQMKRERS